MSSDLVASVLPKVFKEVLGDDKFHLRKKLEKMEGYAAEVYLTKGKMYIIINLADDEDSEGRDFLATLHPGE
jgi:hypothetical protein